MGHLILAKMVARAAWHPRRGIPAGCVTATYLVKVFMMGASGHFGSVQPFCRFSFYIDDLTASARGAAADV